MEAQFDASQFPAMARFQRNNRRTGMKNLRCFPQCSERGHTPSGFCGTTLRCVCKLPVSIVASEVRTWGEFELAEAAPALKIGDVISPDVAALKERSKSDPLKPWVRGDVQEMETVNDVATILVEFNKQLVAWHYSWTSSRYTCDARHMFRCYFFRVTDNDELVVIGVAETPQFQIFSRRRTALMEEAKLEIEKQEKKRRRTEENADSGQRDKKKVVLPRPKKKASSGGDESETLTQRQRRNLVADRLARLMLSRAGQGSGSFYDTDTGPATRASGHGLGDTESISGDLLDFSSDVILGLVSDTALDNKVADVDFDQMIMDTFSPDELEQWTNVNHPSSSSSSSSTSTSASNLYDSQSSSMSAASSSSESIWDKLSVLLTWKASRETRAKAPRLLEVLKTLPDQVIAVSSNRQDIAQFFARWKSQEGIRLLKAQFVDSEKKPVDGFVTSPEEDFQNEPLRGINAPFQSVYAEMRMIYRRVILDALQALGADLDDFVEPMELCAKYGLLHVDPYYPPSKRVAALTHVQLYGSLNNFLKEDYGSMRQEFRDEAQRRAWINAYWTLRRRTFRRHMIQRIAEERISDQLPASARPVPAEFDVNGTWAVCTTKGSLIHAHVVIDVAKAAGSGVGELAGKLFQSMWKRVTLRINDEGLHIQGDRVLLANPSRVFLTDGKPHEYFIPNPLPLPTFAVKRNYVAWKAREGDKCYVHLVTGGRARPAHFDKFVELAKSIPDEEIQAEIETMPKMTEIRLVKRFHVLLPDRETAFVRHSIHLFSSEDAPKFEDFEAIKKLTEPNLPSEISSHEAKYIKIFDGNEISDEILDLLQDDT